MNKKLAILAVVVFAVWGGVKGATKKEIYVLEIGDGEGLEIVYIDEGMVIGGQKGRLDEIESAFLKNCPQCAVISREKHKVLPYEYSGMLDKEKKDQPYVYVQDGDKRIAIYVNKGYRSMSVGDCKNLAKKFASMGAKAECI